MFAALCPLLDWPSGGDRPEEGGGGYLTGGGTEGGGKGQGYLRWFEEGKMGREKLKKGQRK